MPVFEFDDPMEDSEFRRQQKALNDKLFRKQKQKNKEIKELHESLYGQDEEDETLSAIEEAMRQSQELYGEDDDE